jgi:hypothetical protein
MRPFQGVMLAAAFAATTMTGAARAQEPQQPAPTREAAIEQAQQKKAATLHPYEPGTGERLMNKAEDIVVNGGLRWHPFFQNAYAGGGFAVGLGYRTFVSPFNQLDVRGSYSIAGYKRAEMEFTAPHLFHRRGTFTLLGGWREATQVGFYGLGMDTAKDDRTNYDFQQPYGSAMLTIWPARKILMLQGGVEYSEWSLRGGKGTFPSIDTLYSSSTLPGVGARTTYVHGQATVGLDWRTSSGYSRRGGYLGATLHDYTDRDKEFGFQQIEYEAVQHIPILREAWVISLHGRADTTFTKNDQQIPFFMLPSLGGGSTLRGFTSWRYRDRNSLLLQAEWRIMVNRFLDTAFFYDAGKVAARTSDLDLDGLKSDYGFGVRFHGPISTPLRIEVARGNEGLAIIFAASPVF